MKKLLIVAALLLSLLLSACGAGGSPEVCWGNRYSTVNGDTAVVTEGFSGGQEAAWIASLTNGRTCEGHQIIQVLNYSIDRGSVTATVKVKI